MIVNQCVPSSYFAQLDQNNHHCNYKLQRPSFPVQSLRAEPLEGKEISTSSSEASSLGASADIGTAGDGSGGSDKALSAPALVGILVAATVLFCVLAMVWARCRYRRRVALKAEWHSTEMQAPKGGWPSDIPSSVHIFRPRTGVLCAC